jgi:L-fuconolactonase
MAFEGQTSKFLALAACTDPIGAVVGWTDLTAPGIAPEPARLRALLGGEFLAGIRRQVRAEADPTG